MIYGPGENPNIQVWWLAGGISEPEKLYLYLKLQVKSNVGNDETPLNRLFLEGFWLGEISPIKKTIDSID